MLKKGNPPQIIFSSSDARVSQQIGRLLEKGIIRKIEARIYTSNLLGVPNGIIPNRLLSKTIGMSSG